MALIISPESDFQLQKKRVPSVEKDGSLDIKCVQGPEREVCLVTQRVLVGPSLCLWPYGQRMGLSVENVLV